VADEREKAKKRVKQNGPGASDPKTNKQANKNKNKREEVGGLCERECGRVEQLSAGGSARCHGVLVE
jgi:hypothetical protein